MTEPLHGMIVSGDVIPPQTYLHKVAPATREDPGDDSTAENTAEDSAADDAGPADDTVEDIDIGTGADEDAARTEADDEDMAVIEASRTDASPTQAAPVVKPRAGRPGDVPIPEDVSLVGDGTLIRENWMRVQASFVDDPRAAVTAAAGVITDAAARVETAVRQRQQALRDRWDGGGDNDTEALRVTMQQYRQLLERLAAL